MAADAEYLGDGVYADFDGYQIWLHANSYPSHSPIALEPSVMVALERYAERKYEQHRA